MSVWNPSDYAHNSAAQQTWARELIAKLHLQGHEHVLDIGCGDGKVTAEIAASVPQGSVAGIDNSPDMIGFAKAAYEGGNLRFQIADATALPFDAEFDVVFSNACLHWIYDHRSVLHGIRRALKRGGRVLLQMGGKGNAAAILAVAGELMASQQWAPFFRNFSFRYGFHAPEDYHQWLIEAGLKPLRVELIPKTMHHAGREGLAGWIRTTWQPYVNAVPPELRDQFVQEVVSRYLARRPLTADDEALVSMMRLEVECTK